MVLRTGEIVRMDSVTDTDVDSDIVVVNSPDVGFELTKVHGEVLAVVGILVVLTENFVVVSDFEEGVSEATLDVLFGC